MNSGRRGFLGVALALVLPDTGGGSVGNVDVVREAQLPSESNPEMEKLLWGCWNVALDDNGVAVDAGAFPDL